MIESAYAAGQQEPSLIGFLLPIFILVLMYFILIRPQSKKLKEHKKMVAALCQRPFKTKSRPGSSETNLRV